MDIKFSLSLTFADYTSSSKTFRISQVRPTSSAPTIRFEEVLPFKQGTQRISSYDFKNDPDLYVAEDMTEWISVELGISNHSKEVAQKQYAEILEQVTSAVEFIYSKFPK